MIKNTVQAVAIQRARAAAGKRGIAKAVRRFCDRREKEHGDSYRVSVNAFPASWTPQGDSEGPPRSRQSRGITSPPRGLRGTDLASRELPLAGAANTRNLGWDERA